MGRWLRLWRTLTHFRIIRPGRYYSAHTPVFLFVLTLVSGVGLLAGEPRPASVEALLSPAVVLIWAWTLVIGSVLGIAGLVWRGHYVTSMVLEQVGQLMTGCVALVYTVAVYQARIPGSTVGVVIIFGFAVKCLLRAQAIRRHLKALSEVEG